jgi:hypothetical protein
VLSVVLLAVVFWWVIWKFGGWHAQRAADHTKQKQKGGGEGEGGAQKYRGFLFSLNLSHTFSSLFPSLFRAHMQQPITTKKRAIQGK